MNFPEIKVYLLQKTVPDREAIAKWVGDMMPEGETHVVPGLDEATDAEIAVAYPAKRCYKSFEAKVLNPNVTKVRKDLTMFLDNILRSGHGSVLEHATWMFAFENVTRVFTGEMNRHRVGVVTNQPDDVFDLTPNISEGSMRYIRFDDIPFWMPLSIRTPSARPVGAGGHHDGHFYGVGEEEAEIERKKSETRDLIKILLQKTERTYQDLVELWDLDNQPFSVKKKVTSMLRRIMPMGICTGGCWTMNARAMRWIIEQRTNPAAEEEIAHVFNLVAQLMVESEPRLFGDFVDQDGCWTPVYHKV